MQPAKKMPSQKFVTLDIDQVGYDQDGMHDYFWPVSQKELINLRRKLLCNARDLIYENIGHRDWDILHIVYIEIIRELMVLMRSAKALAEFSKTGLNVQASQQNFPYLYAMQNDLSLFPVSQKRLHYLTTPLPNPPKYMRPLRHLKFLLDNTIYKRKTIKNISKGDIITFSSSAFMDRHAQKLAQEGQVVTLCSFWEWYDLSQQDLSIPEFKVQDVNEAQKWLLERLKQTCLEQSFPFSEDIELVMAQHSFNLCHVARIYHEHLYSKQIRSKIPKTLWFGSVNEVRARLLRATVKETGGTTIGHDHGRGFAMALNDGEFGTVFDFCDEMNVYSSHLAGQIRQHQTDLESQQKFFNLERRSVTFSGVDNALITKEDLKKYSNFKPIGKAEKPKVMIMAGVFKGEHYVGLNTLPPDVTFLDFQVRLIQYFNDMGYSVLLKVHPESNIKYPETLKTEYDVDIIGGYIEDQIQNVELIVFDFLSSPFKTLVMTQVPMIYFDFGFSYFFGDIKENIDQRVSLVSGHFDDENKAQIDWESLEYKVKEAKEKMGDKTLLVKVFGVLQ